MDWLDLLAVQGTLKSLLQHHSSKASILWHSAFFIAQLSYPYMTTGKTIALTGWTFFGKVMSLLFHMLSRLVIAFLPRSKCLLISWQQSPFAVILEPQNHFGLQDYSGFLFTRSNLRTRSETISSFLENGRRNSHFLKTYFESGSLVETFIYLFH